MECVILFRNTRNDRVGFVSDDEGDIAVFRNEDEAILAAHKTTVCRAFPYQVVVLDEL